MLSSGKQKSFSVASEAVQKFDFHYSCLGLSFWVDPRSVYLSTAKFLTRQIASMDQWQNCLAQDCPASSAMAGCLSPKCGFH